MTEHLTKSSLERFPDRSASTLELVREVLHLEQCPECRQNWVEVVQYRRSREPACHDYGVYLTSAPSTAGWLEDLPAGWNSYAWLDDEHLSTAEVESYARLMTIDQQELNKPGRDHRTRLIGSDKNRLGEFTELPEQADFADNLEIPEIPEIQEDRWWLEMQVKHLEQCRMCQDAVSLHLTGRR